MFDYLWVFILGGVSSVSLIVFIATLSRDIFLVRKLKQKKGNLLINFSLLLITIMSLSMIIYLFNLLKNQLSLLG